MSIDKQIRLLGRNIGRVVRPDEMDMVSGAACCWVEISRRCWEVEVEGGTETVCEITERDEQCWIT